LINISQKSDYISVIKSCMAMLGCQFDTNNNCEQKDFFWEGPQVEESG
jgi:hypothetical protein